MKKVIKSIAKKMGYTIRKDTSEIVSDIQEPEFWEVYRQCKNYTMTSLAQMYSLYSSMKYIINNGVKGDFVECGVWKGGSSMLMAIMLKKYGISTPKIYMYDTYEGMSEPTDADKDFEGKQADKLLAKNQENKEDNPYWCYSAIEEVRATMNSTGYPKENIVLVKGKVEDSIPGTIPAGDIALLRLDTDWYESTLHELIHLYPKLTRNGVLIIDDYGHWQGCRKAVDEYFEQNKVNILLNRVDYTGRMGIKTLAS